MLGVFFLFPLVLMFLVSFAPHDDLTGDAEKVEDVRAHISSGEFLQNYKEAVEIGPMKTYWRSFWIASVTTLLCLIISYPVAYYIAVIAPLRWRNMLLIAIAIPFWTSFVIRVAAWKIILWPESVGLAYTQTAVLIGLVYCELPFMILPLYASLEKLDKTLLHASADLGASPWQTFWRITVPLTRPRHRGWTDSHLHPQHRPIRRFRPFLAAKKQWLAGNLIQFQFSDTSGSKPMGGSYFLPADVGRHGACS